MSQSELFRTRRGLFHDNIATTGGVRTDKYAAVGLDTTILNPRDPRFTRALRDSLSAKLLVGFNIDPRWYIGLIPSNGWVDDFKNPLPDPLLFRREVSACVVKLLAVGDPVVLDFEKIPHDWQRAFFAGVPGSTIHGWRGTNGQLWNGGTNEGRPTAVTNYFHQDNPLKLYRDCDVALLDQLYKDTMEDVPAWQENEWVRADAAAEGGAEGLVACPIYDALDYKPTDLVTGSYLFNQDRLKVLFT